MTFHECQTDTIEELREKAARWRAWANRHPDCREPEQIAQATEEELRQRESVGNPKSVSAALQRKRQS